MNWHSNIFAFLILLTSYFPIYGQDKNYRAGFEVISTYDSSRIYKPNSVSLDKLHYRPIDIDLWYPAQITHGDTAARFVGFVQLLEKRSNFYDDTRAYGGITEELLQYICAGSDCADYTGLKTIMSGSYVHAQRIDQPFPLIVYFAGLNGMSYENYLLFEKLASKGFVVAAVSSIGRYPGNMSMQIEDLFEQIKDAQFIIDYLTSKNVATSQIGLIGYSWGGLGATLLAMQEPNKIKAVVSLDGSEQFAYGDPKENEQLTQIRNSTFFKPQYIKSSYLYLDSDLSQVDPLPDSLYNLIDFIWGDKDYLKIEGSTHEDFSAISVVSLRDQSQSKYHFIEQLTINYLAEKIKQEELFYSNLPNTGVIKQFIQPGARINSVSVHKQALTGIIKDSKTKLPLAYVNIGILHKEKGTTSNTQGAFELPLDESNKYDTVKISMIGYEPVVICLDDMYKKQKLKVDIALKEKPTELQEIVVMEEKLTTKVLGNQTTSKFFGVKFASNELGSEMAIKIRLKERTTYLYKFNFNISYNSSETATFRVNIYDSKNGLPDKNILRESITIEVKGETGKIEVDLSPYNLVVNKDFFIALEWIDGNSNSGITFSAGLTNKDTYYRKASQGRWKKSTMGVGFTLTAQQ